jgi:general secretion pathway protein D
MRRRGRHLLALWIGAAVVAALLAGCAAQRYYSEGMQQFNAGQREQGLALLAKATQMEPNNSQYRIDYLNQQAIVVRDLLARADAARAAGELAAARELYLAALRVDGNSEKARRGVALVDVDERHAIVIADAERLMKAGNATAARDRPS